MKNKKNYWKKITKGEKSKKKAQTSENNKSNKK